MSIPSASRALRLSCFLLAVLWAGGCAPSTPAVKVNVPGEEGTWFGTARREDIGHVIDYVAIPPSDPRGTFAAHGGKKEGEKTILTLKTPKAGRRVFAYSVMTGQERAVICRYRSGKKWVELPPGRVPPDYFRGWDMREFCYWIDIPRGQRETTFEFRLVASGEAAGPSGDPYSPPSIHAALISEPRVDPFEGMGGGEHPMFDIPTAEQWSASELGRAVLAGAAIGKLEPMSEQAYERAVEGLSKYERMSYYSLINSGTAWAVAKECFKYRATGDERYARIAGAKARRIGSWPTWGYVQEWKIDMDKWAAPGHEQFRKNGPFNRDHTLQSSIVTQAMAIVYDLGCDGMDPSDRIAFRKSLDHYAHLMYVRSLLSPWNTYHHDNWSGHLLGSLGLAGAALRGESRYAEEWLERFRIATPYYLADLVDDAGVHRELMHYTCFGLNPLMLAGVAAERRGGESVFKWAGGRMEKFLTTMLYFASPSGQSMRDFGQGGSPLQMRSHRGLGRRLASVLTVLTRGPRGDLARWMALRGASKYADRGREYRSLSAQEGVMNVLLYKDGPLKAPAAGGDYPLGWHERGRMDYPFDNGYVMMRTGFDSPDDIKMAIKCGNAAGGHGQPCQGSFILDAYGDFLSQAPGYNIWGGRTQAHNLITIDGKGQASDHTWGSGRKSNDGHVERFVHSSAADLCIANNKPAYDGGKNPVRRSLRYFLFVRKPERRGYFVIVDDVQKDDAAHKYTWNFHTTFNHAIEPDGKDAFVAKGLTRKEAIDLWTRRGDERIPKALAKDFPPNVLGAVWPGPTNRHPWVKEIAVDLRIAVVAPAEFTHRITYKGQDWKRKMSIPDHLQITQEAVSPIFLTVLYPEREEMGIKMPAYERIAAEDLRGVKIAGDLILFSRRPGVWKHGDIETDARLLYLTGDVDGRSYAVAEATVLKVAGKTLFESDKRVTAAGGPDGKVTDDGGAWRATSAARGMP